jgi:DNA processing protein
LITARLAGEQGREVFAIPGSPLDPRARGANALIRNGATLAENAEDVLEGIRPMLANQLDEPDMEAFQNADPDDAGRDAARATILECLGPTPVKIDEVLRDTKLSASTVWMILLELELAGRLERLPGGQVALLV